MYIVYFRCLGNLQYLGAGENNLTSIPTEIGKLTYCSRETRKRVIGKQCRPRSMPQNAASDKGLHCFQIV